MNIAQLSEQLKDVPQNRLIDYARNPNSVVPQFLALAEIQRRQHLQAQAAPAPATVAEDVLGQANPQITPEMMAQQLPENQPGVAQLPTGMPRGMASGGIVAFADGGDIDEEDDDNQTEGEYGISKADLGIMSAMAKLRNQASNVIAGLPKTIESVRAKLPQSYEAAKAEAKGEPVKEGDVEGFLSKIQHLESRGRHFDSKGNILTSPKGAEGIMQVMRKTQRDPGFGVTPARDRSPEELERVGRDYGIAMLKEFGDPKLAAMAYNWGPANVKRWLASDRKTPVPAETVKYASHFSKGGIASFAGPYGSLVTNDAYDASSEADDRMFAAPAPEAPIDYTKFDMGFGPGKFEPDYSAQPVDEYGEIKAQIMKSREALKEQAQTDKYLAMLQASLGMMAGSSPYALQNIGQGGMQGVAAYAAAKRQRAAEEAGLDKLGLSLLNAKSSAELRKSYIDATAESRKAETERKISSDLRRTEEKYVDDYNNFIENLGKRAAKNVPVKDAMGLPIDPEERSRLIQIEEARLFEMNKDAIQELADRAKVKVPKITPPAPRPPAPAKAQETPWWKFWEKSTAPASATIDTKNPLLQ